MAWPISWFGGTWDNSSMGRWQEVAHTADLAVHVWGDTLEDLFGTAATAMGTFVGSAAAGPVGVVRTLELSAPDAEALLVDWLNELLYLHDLTRCIFTSTRFEVLSETTLRASVVGYPMASRYGQIKAATYHNLTIVRGSGGYETVIVFDV